MCYHYTIRQSLTSKLYQCIIKAQYQLGLFFNRSNINTDYVKNKKSRVLKNTTRLLEKTDRNCLT